MLQLVTMIQQRSLTVVVVRMMINVACVVVTTLRVEVVRMLLLVTMTQQQSLTTVLVQRMIFVACVEEMILHVAVV